MKITYDREADAVYIRLKELPVQGTKMINSRLFINLGIGDDVVGIEILKASQAIDDLSGTEFVDITRQEFTSVKE